MMEFTALIEQDEDGIYTATIKELKGCHTQAKTREELSSRIDEAIHVFIEDDISLRVSEMNGTDN